MIIRFGEFELDDGAFELRRAGVLVPLEPQVFDVLVHLVRHHERLVLKHELLDEVWGDRFVSDSALSSRIKAVRSALGDDGRAQRFIKTVHGRGYRFVADITSDPPVAAAPGVAPRTSDPAATALVANTAAPTTIERHNLPAERTPLFGRNADVAAIASLLEDHRLVSLLGIGGTGKTRLAAAVGRSVLDRFGDGVWFVDLVPLSDGRSIETAIADAAGLGLTAGAARDQLASLISDRNALFVLDNCEHLLDEVAGALDHVLEHTSGPRFLITSREPIGLVDERRVAVEPLAVESGSAATTPPAVELFEAAAERFGATIALTDHATVRRVCHRLDGIPLAIELAAAQLRHLTLPGLAARLDQRFELLTATTRTGHRRRSSLLSVLEDTWSMLTSEEAALVGQLAVFPGWFRLRDVEELVGRESAPMVARTVAGLVDRSLVVRDAAADRSRLLETVRLFADLHSTEDERRQRRDAHAGWCLDRVGDDVGPHLYSIELASWCVDHHDDLVAAERHLVTTGRAREAAVLTTATTFTMHVDVGARAADTLRRIDEHLGRVDDPGLRARLHLTGTMCGMATRSPDTIAAHGRRAADAAREAAEPTLLATALVLLSWSVVFEDRERALALVDEAGFLARAAGDETTDDLARVYRAFHLEALRRYEDAVAEAERIVARPRAVMDYVAQSGRVVLASLVLLDQPERTAAWTSDLTDLPSRHQAMWGNEVLAAAVHASNGRAAEVLALSAAVRDRLSRAGQQGLPDLIVPAAVLAHRVGRDDLAARWLRAVRDAGRPTQSFQVTCVYRRLRATVGLADDDPLAEHSLDEIGAEAFAWMAGQAG